jgi:hypothetical protein
MKIVAVMQDTIASPVFRLNGIHYLPHYREEVWVQPGAFVVHHNKIRKMDEHLEDKTKRLTARELFSMGAELISKPLWPRIWTKGWEQWLKP